MILPTGDRPAGNGRREEAKADAGPAGSNLNKIRTGGRPAKPGARAGPHPGLSSPGPEFLVARQPSIRVGDAKASV